MRTKRSLTTFVIATAVLAAFLDARVAKAAQTSTCNDEQEKLALNLPDQYQTWNQAYRIFKRFKGCDDGAIAEGFSEAIAQLFIHDWEHLGTLTRLTSSDKAFRKFVLRHIDATLSDNELHAILRNARTRCPDQDKNFCKLVEKSALTSLDELSKD
jgi:hypothetical protein